MFGVAMDAGDTTAQLQAGDMELLQQGTALLPCWRPTKGLLHLQARCRQNQLSVAGRLPLLAVWLS